MTNTPSVGFLNAQNGLKSVKQKLPLWFSDGAGVDSVGWHQAFGSRDEKMVMVIKLG